MAGVQPVTISGAGKTRYSTAYRKFRGVDMSTDPALIDNTRSPYAPNLISDSGGYPEKRPGWRTVYTMSGRINGMHSLTVDGETHMLIHAGTAMYLAGSEPVALKTDIADSRSTSFVCVGKLWILTGAEYLVYDGTLLRDVTEIAHVPTVTIGSEPAGGGTDFEPVNLLTPQRIREYRGDGTSKVYTLDADGIDSVTEVKVNGTVTTAYTADTAAGTVTFTEAPSKPAVTGEDNVSIRFSKTVAGYADTIKKCRFAGVFGLGGTDSERVFFAGNPDRPNVDWHCETSAPEYLPDPSYIPDTSFAYIGSDANAIMGYRRMGGVQLIIKGQSDQDATVFRRSATLDADGNAAFPLTQGAAGVGAVSMYAFATLMDEPLFLGKNGVYGILTDTVTAENAIQNRSYFVDAKLTKQAGLADACAVEWDGYYLLSAGDGTVYILDGKQNKVFKERSGGSYVYECYIWTGVPARVLYERDGELWFGTADGKVCRFAEESEGMARYNDDGAAISASWATKADDDGDFTRYKTCNKRWLAVMLKPFTRSSAKVYVVTEKDIERLVGERTMDIFDFSDVDFSRFSFNTAESPQVMPINAKTKKYITMQVIVKNDAKDEGFGVFGVKKWYTFGSYVKR